MKKLIIMLFLVAITFSSHADSKIHQFQDNIEKKCGSVEVNPLLVKKSLIELIKGGGCESKFTTIVLKKCEELECKELQAIYKNVQQTRAGSVVGDQ